MRALIPLRGSALLLLLLSSCAMPTGGSASAQYPPRPPASYRGTQGANVLLFNGPSVWGAELDSLENSLIDHGVSYQQITPDQLNAMTLEQISSYTLLVVPGGDAPSITHSMTAATHENLRRAVQERGMSYLGFCAGAWLAVAPAPEPGKDVAYGVGLVDGPLEQQTPYYKQGKEFAIVNASFPDGSHRDLLWYGGPITPNTPGGVIAKYPDGNPAITQIWSGKGFVIVSGLHPTANQAILDVLGLSDPQAIAPDLAWELLDAAIEQKPAPTF